MNDFNKYEIPWDIIAADMQGEISEEQAAQLQQWLAMSPLHEEKYQELRHIWAGGMEDYPIYQAANESSAWEALQKKLAMDLPAQASPVVHIRAGAKVFFIKRWAAIAAVFLLTLGAIFWYRTGLNNVLTFETAENQQKKVTLPDGTVINLKPQTKIQTSADYGRLNRAVVFLKGEAIFEIIHKASMPFIVNMGASSVQDIGTVFTIQKRTDSIKITVSEGKVAFIKNTTRETHELAAGMSLSFNITNERFGDIISFENSSKKGLQLNFNNASLREVVRLLQEKYARKIELADSLISQRRLTAQLDEESFDNTIKIICKSLNLVCIQKNNVYMFKDKNKSNERPKK